MIDRGPAMVGPEEPSICVNPANTKHIIAGANISHVYTSDDGGYTWTSETLKSETHGVYGDPCIIANKDGSTFFFHLSNPDGLGWASDSLLDRIVCQRSDDFGKTWNDGSAIGYNPPKDQDKEWAVINPINNHIYVTWTQFDKYNSKEPEDSSYIMFSKSVDNGESWSSPIRINHIAGNCLDDDYTVEGAVPAVGPNGEIYVAWSYGDKIYFNCSFDDGDTWQNNDIVITTGTGGWNMDIPGINRCNGMPVTVCDLSDGPNRGTIYVNWSDTRNGEDDPDIWITKSNDKGQTWSEAKRVNNDEGKSDQFLTWLSIDQTNGHLYTVFYDRRNYEDRRTDVYLAYSDDGAENFTNICISDSAFVPKPFVFFGDYNNISAHAGVIRPIWTRLDGSYLSVWTAILDEKKLNKIRTLKEK